MINLCLPMKVICVTQRSGGSYSHPNNCLDLAGSDSGIDFAYALGDYWRCIAGPWGSHTYFFTACDEKGNTVKVHCADNINRVVTVAMTHAAFIYVKAPTIGRIYKNGEPLYEEGTYSSSASVHVTGNHIHYEVAEGLQYSKYYDKSMGVYRMNNELKPEDVCFICDSFSTVKSTCGVSFRHCPGIYSEDIYVEMKVGMNTYAYGDVTLTAFVKPDYCKLGLFNSDTVNIIEKIGEDPKYKFHEKCGNDFFQMKTGQTDPYGTVYGPRVCVNGPIDQPSNQPDKYLYYRLDKDGTVSFGDYGGGYIDEQWLKDNVQMCCSPQMIFCKDWEYPKYAPMAGNSSIVKQPYYQAYFGRNKDGRFFAGVSKQRISASDVWKIFRENFGVTEMAFMDGGSAEGHPGSAQQIYYREGELVAVQYTGRQVRDILAFYEDANVNEPVTEPTEPEDPIEVQPTTPITPNEPFDNGLISYLDSEFKRLKAENEKKDAEIERLHRIIDQAKEVLNDA